MQYKAVLIDVDGTAVLSEQRNREAIEAVARQGGFTILPEHWNEFAGGGDEVIWQKIVDRFPDLKNSYETAESFEQACNAAYAERIEQVKANPAILEIVADAKARGMMVAIVSNSLKEVVDLNLRHTKYPVDDMDTMVCKDQVREKGMKTKPAPDPYVIALANLNKIRAEQGQELLTADECIILEDSGTGARAGLDFGAVVVQVTDESGPLPHAEVKKRRKDFLASSQNAVEPRYHAMGMNSIGLVWNALVSGLSHRVKADTLTLKG